MIATGLFSSGQALAGPPLFTDDPETPGQHGWEVNVSNNIERTRSLLTVAAPYLDINYGTLPNDQWKIEFPLIQFAEAETGDSEPHAGVGDVLIGYKYRFLDEAKAGISVSVYPQFLLPIGNSDLEIGAGNTEFLAEFQFGKHFFNEKLFVYAELGLTACFNDSQFDSWDYGVAADWKVTKKFELMGDVAGHAFPNATDESYTFFEVGTAYHFNDTVAFIGSAGSSFRVRGSDVPEFTSFLGFQFTWGAEKSDEAETKNDSSGKSNDPLGE